MDELDGVDGVGTAALVRDGQISAAEAVEAAIARIDAVNPLLNAVIWPLFDEALDAARVGVPDGPFAGVPFLMKDIGATQAGQPLAMGNRALRDAGYRTTADSELGARFRNAGFITVGKTNVPEFGISATTQPVAFGPTRNPWDLTRSPNGSSGGACAAVAAGLVPIAHGNDGGGSIRLPAAWCGLVGLKPSRGRVALPFGMATIRSINEFAVCRTIRDAAAVLDTINGTPPGALYTAAPPVRPYADIIRDDPSPLRIATVTNHPRVSIDPACLHAVQSTAELLDQLGHHITPDAEPPLLFQPNTSSRGLLSVRANAQWSMRHAGQLIGRDLTEDDVEPPTWAMAHLPVDDTAADFIAAAEETQAHTIDVCRWWHDAGIDVLITPTVPYPALPLADMVDDPADHMRIVRRTIRTFTFTAPFNTTGEPAISLPLHHSPDGLPVGVQLVAPHGREDILLQLAAQLERAHPWHHRQPPTHTSRHRAGDDTTMRA